MSISRWFRVGCWLLSIAPVCWAAGGAPEAVSPGSPGGASIGDPCPTFSWGAVPGAASYELVVYRLGDEGAEAAPVLSRRIPGTASSWTPSLDLCLERGGRYGWSVRAAGSAGPSQWSRPSLFQVAAGPSQAELADALAVVQRYFSLRSGDTGAGVIATPEPAAPRREADRTESAVAPGTRGAAATELSVEGGIEAASFTGDGSQLTDLAPANLAPGTAGIDISGTAANVTGTVAVDHGGTGATDPASARANLGAAADAALAAHAASDDHGGIYVNLAGDTMTGALELPADGLAVGTDQLVTAGGMVGIGISPTRPLHVDAAVGGPLLQVVSRSSAADDVLSIASAGAVLGQSLGFFGNLTTSGGLRVRYGDGSTADMVLETTFGKLELRPATDLVASGPGNVGIGTSSPGERLEVSGNVKAAGFMGDGSALTSVSAADVACPGCVDETDLGFNAVTQEGLALHTADASAHHAPTIDTDTTYTAGTGLVLEGTTFRLGGVACPPGEFLSGIDASGAQCGALPPDALDAVGAVEDALCALYLLTGQSPLPDLCSTEVSFVLKWGSFGSGDGQFNSPYSIARDGSGNVYVADLHNHRIQKFDADGNFITKWGSNGTGDGQFDRPVSVAVDGSGSVFVSDHQNHRVQKFDGDGNFLAKWGGNGTGDGQFSYTGGITVDGSGSVYVTDYGNDRIQKFDNDGNFLSKWGSSGSGDGQFRSPHGIDIDSAGNIYVVDVVNHRVQKFDGSGAFLAKWGGLGSGDGQFSFPRTLAIDGLYVYVADENNSRIQKFFADGTFLLAWGSAGTGDGQFTRPHGVAVDGQGHIYVTERDGHRVQKFLDE